MVCDIDLTFALKSVFTLQSTICLSRILYIDGLRSGKFYDLSIISQWEKNQVAHFFTNTRWNSKPYHEWYSLWSSLTIDANVADHDYADCWPCDSFEVSWRYQRLPKYLLTVSHRKEIQTRSRPHCIQLNRTHRMICILTLQFRWGHVNYLRSAVDLGLMWSTYAYFDAYQRRITMIFKYFL